MARNGLANAVAVAILIAILAVAPAWGDAPPAGTSAPPLMNDFFGIVSNDTFASLDVYGDRQLASQRAHGIGSIRQTFDWSQIEVSPRVYDFRVHDVFVAAAARHGIRVLPVLAGTPSFYARQGNSRGMYPPRRPGLIAPFARALVLRYGPGGSFWSEHPGVAYLPIRSWQIWNEPNLRAYWPPKPDARAYVALLRSANRAIKKVHRRAEVVAAGLADSRMGVPVERYIRGLYRAGGRSAFDTLAIHPYARNAYVLLYTLRRVRGLMDNARDRRARLWVTEFGWADGGPPSPYTVGERAQARELARTIRLLGEYRRVLRLRGAVYYSWKDGQPYAPHFRDFWGLHTGLHDVDGTPKPAAAALDRAVASVARRTSRR